MATHTSSSSPVMPLHDLHGATVRDAQGERIGRLSDVDIDEDGRIVGLDVRPRWFLGHHRHVPADGMRLVDGEIVVAATTADLPGHEQEEGSTSELSHPTRAGETVTQPVYVRGREGAKRRFGGLDLLASLLGTMVALGTMILIGGLVAAVVGSEPAVFDTSVDSWRDAATVAGIAASAALFLSFFVGGWATGRMSRYDGVGNGLMLTVWALLIGLVFGGLGYALGEEYDVVGATNLPAVNADELAVAGVVAFGIAIVLMLLGGGLGGALGESWHRRVDRSLLDVVPVGGSQGERASTSDERAPGTTSPQGRTGNPVAPQPFEDPQRGDGRTS